MEFKGGKAGAFFISFAYSPFYLHVSTGKFVTKLHYIDNKQNFIKLGYKQYRERTCYLFKHN